MSNKKNKTTYIYGKHAVSEALRNPIRNNLRLYCTPNHDILKENVNNIPTKLVAGSFLKQLLNGEHSHQGVILETTTLKQPNFIELEKRINQNQRNLIIILDQLTDPNNIGSIIRTAACFNAIAVINTINNAPSETPAITKVSSGGFEKVPYIQVVNIANIISKLKELDFWCYGLDGTAKTNLHNTKPSNNQCLILGSEDKGIRTLLRKKCDLLVKINSSNLVESLNVANAASIAMNHYYNHL